MTVRRYRQIAVVTLVGLAFLTVAGVVVRLTGSGLGCADWPGCSEQRFIDVSSTHTAIEQANRLLSGLIGLPTLALLVLGLRATRRGDGLRWPAVGTFLLVIANGLVGRFVVTEDLHPAVVQSHFLLAMVALLFATVAAVRAREFLSTGETVPIRRPTDSAQMLTVALGGLTFAALATGTVVTGSGPHAGDENAIRYGFDISTVAEIHSVTVIVTVLVGVALAVLASRRHDHARQNDLSGWLFVALLQGVVGYAQYFTGVPELLVATHVAGATALWIMTVRLVLRSSTADSEVMAAAGDGSTGGERGVSSPSAAAV
ncbi:MAG: COX15/CtaA family protein [Actinomycetota bacterium]